MPAQSVLRATRSATPRPAGAGWSTGTPPCGTPASPRRAASPRPGRHRPRPLSAHQSRSAYPCRRPQADLRSTGQWPKHKTPAHIGASHISWAQSQYRHTCRSRQRLKVWQQGFNARINHRNPSQPSWRRRQQPSCRPLLGRRSRHGSRPACRCLEVCIDLDGAGGLILPPAQQLPAAWNARNGRPLGKVGS